MADYFLSDVHLRLDHPGRGERLARLVDTLKADDALWIVGDLCDFWYAARQVGGNPRDCQGLRSLIDFRSRGGSLTILGGNHDGWLGPFYEQALGARFVADGLDLERAGLRIHVAHGHRLGARTAWKAGMESRGFLEVFRRLPAPVAGALGAQLERTNRKNQEAFDRRGLAILRQAAHRMASTCDLLILGHVHLATDDRDRKPRLVVLGGWHAGSSYLVIDETTIEPVVQNAS